MQLFPSKNVIYGLDFNTYDRNFHTYIPDLPAYRLASLTYAFDFPCFVSDRHIYN